MTEPQPPRPSRLAAWSKTIGDSTALSVGVLLLLLGLLVALAVGIGWCEIALAYLALGREGRPSPGLAWPPGVATLVILISFAIYYRRARDAVRRRLADRAPAAPAPPPEPPPPPSPPGPEALEAMARNNARAQELRAAKLAGRCPKCGAPGFLVSESVQSTMSGFTSDGRLTGGMMVELHGRCSACGHEADAVEARM